MLDTWNVDGAAASATDGAAMAIARPVMAKAHNIFLVFMLYSPEC
jgi:hypothetical protein